MAVSAISVSASSVDFSSSRVSCKSDTASEAKFLCPCDKRAVAGDFVVLDRLGGGEQTGIKGGRAFIFPHYFSAFFGDAADGRASFALRLLVDCREYLFKTSDLFFSLSFVLLKRSLELFA